MNIETKDVNEMIINEMEKNVDNIKKKYLDQLIKILNIIDEEVSISYDKKIESITGCKTIIESFKDNDNKYINPILEENLESILNIMKKTYIEDSLDLIAYTEIRKKLIKIINDINDVDLTSAINFTKKYYNEMIMQGIEEV